MFGEFFKHSHGTRVVVTSWKQERNSNFAPLFPGDKACDDRYLFCVRCATIFAISHL